MNMNKAKLVDELVKILYTAGEELLTIVKPPKGVKPKWCNCSKCGQWHYMAK